MHPHPHPRGQHPLPNLAHARVRDRERVAHTDRRPHPEEHGAARGGRRGEGGAEVVGRLARRHLPLHAEHVGRDGVGRAVRPQVHVGAGLLGDGRGCLLVECVEGGGEGEGVDVHRVAVIEPNIPAIVQLHRVEGARLVEHQQGHVHRVVRVVCGVHMHTHNRKGLSSNIPHTCPPHLHRPLHHRVGPTHRGHARGRRQHEELVHQRAPTAPHALDVKDGCGEGEFARDGGGAVGAGVHLPPPHADGGEDGLEAAGGGVCVHVPLPLGEDIAVV
mmetsp:Transcript_59242/g.145444  ORF Transcript_59242/g.145444 Transcript_59242/m.145444 type:complete len:274 (-) Transcript_59242:68-889(-)